MFGRYIFFLKPSKGFETKCRDVIQNCGYVVKKEDNKNSCWSFQKETSSIDMALCEDYIGSYIIIECQGISEEILHKSMLRCPECGAGKVRPSILFCWRNEITERLYEEGKLDYIPGAYDRFGTSPKTHECLKCGCQWHNEASIYLWNEAIKRGEKLTAEILGLD